MTPSVWLAGALAWVLPPFDVHDALAGVLAGARTQREQVERVLAVEDAPALVFESLVGEVPTAATQPVLAAVLDRLGRVRALEPARAEFAGEAPRVEAAGATLFLVERVGRGVDLALAVRAAELAGATAPLDAPLERALLAATGEVLRRDPRGLLDLERPFEAAGAAVRTLLLRAVGRSHAPGTSDWLAERLGDADLDLVVLAELTRPQPASRRMGEGGRARVRAHLVATDPQLRREAARVQGVHRDQESVPLLAELLDDEHEAVRRAAHTALVRCTGLSLPARAERWELWWANERRWYDSRALKLYGDLDDADAQVVGRALQELSLHRYRADEHAARIGVLLGDADRDVRLAVLEALRKLASDTVADELEELQHDPDTGVRNSARRALDAIRARG